MQEPTIILSHSSSSCSRVKYTGRGWRLREVRSLMVSLLAFSVTPSGTRDRPPRSVGAKDRAVPPARPRGAVRHKTAGRRVELPILPPVAPRNPALAGHGGRARYR